MINFFLPSLAEISKVQEQILLPFFIKLSRLQEQFLLDTGIEKAADLDPRFLAIYKQCQDHTLTSIKSMYAMYEAALYIAKAGIEGDYVECGVWKGGSSMIVALALLQLKSRHRNLYLYDTYQGMPETGDHDHDLGNSPFQLAMNISTRLRGGHSGVFYAELEEVSRNMQSTGYPQDHIFLIKGLVEETIPFRAPEQISLLHLDSDLYQSTYHELTHLFPRLSKGGVLIVDDYGSWKGSRKATDQYFAEHGISMLLSPIGNEGARMGIKT
jgi:O-methyltransferase